MKALNSYVNRSHRTECNVNKGSARNPQPCSCGRNAAQAELKALKAEHKALRQERDALRQERNVSFLQLMDEIEIRHGVHEDRWNILRDILIGDEK